LLTHFFAVRGPSGFVPAVSPHFSAAPLCAVFRVAAVVIAIRTGFPAFRPFIATPSLAHLVLLSVRIPARVPTCGTLPTCEAMHTLLSTRLTRAALKAARPARRHMMRALRHHAARTRALGEQWRDARAVDGIRTWFHTFFSALRQQRGTRRLSLRTLLRKPTPLRLTVKKRAPEAPIHASRRPRRLSTSSSGWFAFAFASR
jgi:hypothetical protein